MLQRLLLVGAAQRLSQALKPLSLQPSAEPKLLSSRFESCGLRGSREQTASTLAGAARAWTLGLRLHLIGQIGMTVFYCMVLAAGQHNLASEQREDSWAAK